MESEDIRYTKSGTISNFEMNFSKTALCTQSKKIRVYLEDIAHKKKTIDKTSVKYLSSKWFIETLWKEGLMLPSLISGKVLSNF